MVLLGDGTAHIAQGMPPGAQPVCRTRRKPPSGHSTVTGESKYTSLAAKRASSPSAALASLPSAVARASSALSGCGRPAAPASKPSATSTRRGATTYAVPPLVVLRKPMSVCGARARGVAN